MSLTLREAYLREPLAYFARLGKTIGHRWSARQNRLEAFPDLAYELLEEMPAHRHVDPAVLLETVIATPGFVNQGSSDDFGDPAVPVYLDPRFHVEVLFWFNGTARIHHHTFVGAFQVLSGSSVHSHYTFGARQRHGPGFAVGDLRLERIERLKPGDVRRILPGGELIHALFHLEHPSTTVVVRTHTQPQYLPALGYFTPGVALDAHHSDRPLLLKQRAIQAAMRMDRSRVEPLTELALEGADPTSRFLLLSSYTSLTPERARRAAFWERLHHIKGSELDELIPVFEEQARAARLMRLRDQVREPTLRYFLALLLNCPTTNDLLALTSDAFPDADPRVTVRAWLAELGELIDAEMLGLMSDVR